MKLPRPDQPSAPDTPRRLPNLLLVFADQMRYMSLGCAGEDEVRTPHLDRFAREGANLTNAVSNCPICAPHRASLLTGRYPLGNTVFTNNIQLPPSMPSLGKMLKTAGHATGYIGKWHLAGEPAQKGFVPPGPMRHGFDHWAVHNCSHKYWDGTYYRDDPTPRTLPGWEVDGQTDMALDFLRSNAKSQASGGPPFALVMSWGPPHTPFIAPQEFEAMYDPARIALRPNVQMRDDWIRLGDNGSYKGPYTDPEMVLKHFIARYYAMVSNLDNNFGRLLKGLDDLNLAENTVVVFTSDHGDMLGSHGQLHKGQPWDESVRVPLLIRFPGVIPPRLESGAPFNTPDILPTLLGLMRLSVPKGVEGEDLSAILRGEDVKEPSSCFLLCPCAATTWGGHWKDLAFGGRGIPPGFMRPYRGIRTRTHTYVRDRKGPWLLYDNEKDPHQLTDLVETQGRAAVPPELERELNDWLERTGDFFGDNAEYERYVDLTTGLALQPRTLRRE